MELCDLSKRSTVHSPMREETQQPNEDPNCLSFLRPVLVVRRKLAFHGAIPFSLACRPSLGGLAGTP